MDFFEFIQWCFKDFNSGVASIIVLGILVNGFVRLVKAIRGNSNQCDCDEEDEED